MGSPCLRVGESLALWLSFCHSFCLSVCLSQTPPTLPPPVLCHNNVSDVLETVARETGFTVHEVPRDGNCLFSSVAYQSKISSDKLRSMLVSYLRENCTHYSNFVSQAVSSDDASNADTEPPDEYDAYIASVKDPEEQAQLRWERYCLTNIHSQALQGIYIHSYH